MPVQYEPWGYKNDIEDLWGIIIKEGKFSGTTLSFNDVKLSEETSDMILDYTVIRPPEGMNKEDVAGPAFDDTMKDIMQDILTNAISYAESEHGKDNFTKSSEQSGVHEKGSSLSQI